MASSPLSRQGFQAIVMVITSTTHAITMSGYVIVAIFFSFISFPFIYLFAIFGPKHEEANCPSHAMIINLTRKTHRWNAG